MTRWTIEVRMKTSTRLAVGTGTMTCAGADTSGAPTAVPDEVLVSDVQLDERGCAGIPGAGVRGACRAWMRRNFPDRDLHLFGTPIQAGPQDDRQGGRLSFRWAHSSGPVSGGGHDDHARWDARSRTAVDAAVALDPTSRTAAEHLLRFYRYVPAGVEFTFRIGARDVEEGDIERIVAALLALGGRGASEMRIGGSTGNGSGAFVLAGQPNDSVRITRTTPNHVAQWLAEGAPQTGFAVGVHLSAAELNKVLAEAATLAATPRAAPRRARFELALDFSERLLVKSLLKSPDSASTIRARRDSAGNVMVPSRSFRGVLRAQVARIARTLGQQSPTEDGAMICSFSPEAGHGCGHRDGQGNQRPVDALCVVCALFGAAGWMSPLECGDFTARMPSDAGPKIDQTHVAIDRFTGGAAAKYLYETESQFGPTVGGHLSLDLGRLDATGKANAAVGLLIMALRDLVEGDLSFGMGRSKGFGWCKGRITNVVVSGQDAASSPFAALEQLTGLGAAAMAAGYDSAAGPFLAAARGFATVQPSTPMVTTPGPSATRDVLTEPQAADDEFHNPYHFIPVRPPGAERIVLDADGTMTDGTVAGTSGMTHALYRSDHFSGSVRCRLVAESEVVIGAKRGEARDNHPTPVSVFEVNGGPAIPGSSLRGMFTSLGEAASNSALRVLEKRALARRAEMSESLPAIGILEDVDGAFFVRPLCPGPLPSNHKGEFVPDIDTIESVFRNPTLRVYLSRTEVDEARGKGLVSSSDYVGIRMPDMPFDWRDMKGVGVDAIPDGMHLKFSKITRKGRLLLGRVAPDRTPLLGWEKVEETLRSDPDEYDNWLRGHLLVLGDPRQRQMPAPNQRHYEVFIPDPDLAEEDRPPLLPVGSDVAGAFHALADEIFNPNERGTSQRPYEPLRQRRTKAGPYRLRGGDLVFFECKRAGAGPVVTRLALSSIWRREIYLGATTRELFRDLDGSGELLPFNRDRRTLSIGEALFGWVRDDDQGLSLQPHLDERRLRAFASRIRFGTTRPGVPASDTSERAPGLTQERVLKLLATPKPPSPATYLGPDGHGTAHTKESLDRANTTPQGRKYYLHGGTDTSPWLPGNPRSGGHMHVRTRAIRQDSVFEFNVAFDNLTQFELGLLLYCLRPTDAFRHKIGMGKPLGLGTVRVDIGEVQLVDRIARYASDGLAVARSRPLGSSDLSALRDAFERTVDDDVRRAIRLLGESTGLRRVLYPHGRTHPSSEFYRWFVWNERGPRHHLRPLTAETPSLPTLPVKP